MYRRGATLTVTDMIKAVIGAVFMVLLAYFMFVMYSVTTAAIAEGFLQMDGSRVQNGVWEVSGAGTANVTLKLHNEVTSMSMSGNTLTLETGQDQSAEFVLPKLYSYSIGSNDDNTLCIMKEGLNIRVDDQCSQLSCSQGACTAATHDSGGSNPEWGYRCSNGAYTEREFFTQVYRHGLCGVSEPSGTFLRINRFDCPDEVRTGRSAGCTVEFTARCNPGSSVSVTLEPQSGTSQSYDTSLSRVCTGDIEHGRYAGLFTFNVGSHTVSLTLGGGGATQTAQTDITVKQRSGTAPQYRGAGP